MCADHFAVAGFDATSEQGGSWNELPTPFLIRGHRPDAWGARADEPLLAFAEAKTATDINNAHTLAQIHTFGHFSMKGSRARCPLYIAIPRCESRKLDEILIKAGLAGARNIVRLHVPEVLLGGRRYAA